MPIKDKYGHIEEIAQYNRDNGTNFYRWDQVQQHIAAQKQQQYEKDHPFLASLQKSAGEARDARIGAVGAQQVRSAYDTGNIQLAQDLSKSYLGANATGIMSAPLGGEFVTYGLWGGLGRIGGGFAGSAAGSWGLGKAGDYADKKLGTNWIGTTGRIVGGFAGFVPGMNLGYKGAIKLASKVPSIARIGSTSTFRSDVVGQAFGSNVNDVNFIPGQVKYYGPTMGKTTAVKTNPNLVDFDDIMRQPSKDLLKKYGFKSKYEMFESGNQEAINEYQNMLVKAMQDFKANPQNSGRTLVVSQSPVVNPEVTGFKFDNEPSIPSKENFVTRNVGRGGTEVDSADWWTNLMERNPNLKIDNRFVSEIEGNKVLNFTPRERILGVIKRNPERDWNTHSYLSDTYFGEPLPAGSESDAFISPISNDVIKIHHGEYRTPQEAIEMSNKRMETRNKLPFIQVPIKRIGLMKGPNKSFTSVYSQKRLSPLDKKLDLYKDIKPILDSRMQANGYTLSPDDFIYLDKTGKRLHLSDLKNDNFGIDDSGKLMGFDIDIYKQGGKIDE